MSHPAMEKLEERQARLGDRFQAQVDALNTWLSANKATSPEIIYERNLAHLKEWYAYSLESLDIRMAKARVELDLTLNLSKKLRQEMLKDINEEEKTEKVKLKLQRDEKRQELKLERNRKEMKRDLECLRVELEQDLEREQAEMQDKCTQKQADMKAKFERAQVDLRSDREQKLTELKAKLVRDEAELKLLKDKLTDRERGVELHSIGREQEKEKLELKSQKDLEETFQRRRVDLERTSKRELAALEREYDHERAMLDLDLRSQKEEKALDLEYKLKRIELNMEEKYELITHQDCLEQKRDLEKQADNERKRSREQLDKERQPKQCEIHNDENIRLFLKSMRNEDVVQGSVLRLPAGVSLGGMFHLGHLGGKLLVRACYMNLCALLFEECKIGQVEEEGTVRNRRFVILGNPGIGKSLFSYYLLYRLMQEKVTVVWEPYNTHSRVLITPDAIRFGDVKTGFGTHLSSSSTWYIVDTMEPANVNANIVLVSWPKKEIIKTFQKTAMSLCMPVWSRAEMDLAAQLGLANTRSGGLPVTAERIERLFHLCGGIPRYVFERPELEMEDLEGGLKLTAKHTAKCLIDGTIDMHSYRSYPAPASYWMIKIVPPTQDGPKRYRGFNVEFTSTRVEEIVAKSVNALQEADRFNFLNRCKELDSFATFSGKMVDNYGHSRS